MPKGPAARLGDLTSHGSPLAPGPGCVTVMIGKKPAWRAANPAAGAAIMAAATANFATATSVGAASIAAAPTPGAPAALAAESSTKASLVASFASMGAGADTHMCPMPVPPPGLAPVPHGPGFVALASMTVMVGKLPQARIGDQVMEAIGGPDPIAMGEFTVIVGG